MKRTAARLGQGTRRRYVEARAMTEPEAGVPARPAPPLEALGSIGKVVTALAGAGVLLYVTGVVVVWQRLASEGLQQQAVIAVMPRDQLAVAGAREALVSMISAAIFGLFLYWAYRAFESSRRSTASHGLRARMAGWMRKRPATVITVLIAVACALLGPLAVTGVACLALFLAIAYIGTRSAHRSLIGKSQDFRTSPLPWLRVALGLSSAVLVASIARTSEFPDRFPLATVTEGACVTRGLYLGATADGIALGKPELSDASTDECRTPDADAGNTLLVTGEAVARIRLTRGVPADPPHRSLLHHLGVPIECIFPECQIKGRRHGVLDLFIRGSPSR